MTAEVLSETSKLTAGLFTSKTFTSTLLETWVALAMLQVVVIDCWPGATCCIVVQLPPLSNEYETFTKLAATWVQLMIWFWPTGKFWLLCLQVSESFRLGTRLNNPVVPLTLALFASTTRTLTKLV